MKKESEAAVAPSDKENKMLERVQTNTTYLKVLLSTAKRTELLKLQNLSRFLKRHR